jgi:hypothetical protein
VYQHLYSRWVFCGWIAGQAPQILFDQRFIQVFSPVDLQDKRYTVICRFTVVKVNNSYVRGLEIVIAEDGAWFITSFSLGDIIINFSSSY